MPAQLPPSPYGRYTLGQRCSRKRNLTWGVHWLLAASARKQPDAMAFEGFLHASNALKEVMTH